MVVTLKDSDDDDAPQIPIPSHLLGFNHTSYQEDSGRHYVSGNQAEHTIAKVWMAIESETQYSIHHGHAHDDMPHEAQ